LKVRHYILYVCALLFVVFGEASAQTIAQPPAHLPRLMWECEAGAGFSSCSVWMWQGSSYSAIWSNGAHGQLTVASGDAPDLRVQRTDTSGNLTGLNAVYTGKWDGTSIIDGKLTYTFKGNSGSGGWSGKTEATPVVHLEAARGVTGLERNNDMPVSGSAPYVNWNTADLTGFTIHIRAMGPSVAIHTAIEDYRTLREPPLKPGERRSLSLRAAPIPSNYEKGAAYRDGEVITAIFSDGTTFGDRNVLAVMLNRRRLIIAALTSIGTTLCTLGSQRASVADIQAALDKKHGAENARSPAESAERNDAYDSVFDNLRSHPPRLTDSQVIQRAWDHLNQYRSGLAADPVKDASGQLAIAPVTPLACNLP
jgi:hypothetical protein